MSPAMEVSYNEHVSAEIRAEMARQRLSQLELARRLRWSRAALSRRITGSTGWSLDEVEAVAGVLGVPLPALVGSSRS